MGLEIGDRVVKPPPAADIAAAIGARELPDDWYLTLTENGGVALFLAVYFSGVFAA